MAGGPWKFLLVESSIPNAFVSEMIPHHIFVTTSMIEHFITNDDEMALIMGHELSHLILGHVSRANQLEAFLRAFEVLLLTIDPTEGAMASLAFLFVVSSYRSLLGAGARIMNEKRISWVSNKPLWDVMILQWQVKSLIGYISLILNQLLEK
jgi:hypothetical protein